MLKLPSRLVQILLAVLVLISCPACSFWVFFFGRKTREKRTASSLIDIDRNASFAVLKKVLWEACDKCCKLVIEPNLSVGESSFYNSIIMDLSSVWVNSKSDHPPPPRANPRAFDLFNNARSNSPLYGPISRSNAPLVGAENSKLPQFIWYWRENC